MSILGRVVGPSRPRLGKQILVCLLSWALLFAAWPQVAADGGSFLDPLYRIVGWLLVVFGGIRLLQGINREYSGFLKLDGTDLRQHVATQLSQVQTALDGMMVDRPRRRIIRNDHHAVA